MRTAASYQAGKNGLSHVVIRRSHELTRGTHVGTVAFLASVISLLWLVGFATAGPTHTTQTACDAAVRQVQKGPGNLTPSSPLLKPVAESCTVTQIYNYALGLDHGHLSQRSKIRLPLVGYLLTKRWPGSPLAASYKAAGATLPGP